MLTGKPTVRVRHSHPVAPVVLPSFPTGMSSPRVRAVVPTVVPAVVAAVAAIVPTTVPEERVVDVDGPTEPVRAPAPTPAPGPAAEPEPDVDSQAESEARSVRERRIGAPRRGSPDIDRIVLRHVDHLRIGRHDLDDGLPVLNGGGDRLLRSGGELAR